MIGTFMFPTFYHVGSRNFSTNSDQIASIAYSRTVLYIFVLLIIKRSSISSNQNSTFNQ